MAEPAIKFDTAAAVEQLIEAGIPREHAAAQVRLLADTINDNFATKADIERLELKLDTRIAEVRSEIANLRAAVHTDGRRTPHRNRRRADRSRQSRNQAHRQDRRARRPAPDHPQMDRRHAGRHHPGDRRGHQADLNPRLPPSAFPTRRPPPLTHRRQRPDAVDPHPLCASAPYSERRGVQAVPGGVRPGRGRVNRICPGRSPSASGAHRCQTRRPSPPTTPFARASSPRPSPSSSRPASPAWSVMVTAR